jgi:hypothetical protein
VRPPPKPPTPAPAPRSDARKRALHIKSKTASDRVPRVGSLGVEGALGCGRAGGLSTAAPADAMPLDVQIQLLQSLSNPSPFQQPPLRFQKAIYDSSELEAVRAVREAGLAILGFKSASRLGLQHTAGTARFVYPDERHMRGSTAAFVALHKALLDKVRGGGGAEGVE